MMDIPAPIAKSSSYKFAFHSARQLMGYARNLLRVLPIAALALLLLPVAHAQFRASLRGTVTDPSGAVVPGATVTLIDKDTGAGTAAVSNSSGIYTFNGLPPAHYQIKVVRSGFQTKVLSNVQIIPEQANTVNIVMQVGKVQQTVTVSALTLGLPTSTATLSQTINSQQIQHMPSFNRDVFKLAELTPGVFGDASQASGGGNFSLPGNQGPGGPTGGQAGIFATENGPQVQDRGGQYETNSISVDGISTVSAVWGGTSIITPSEDSIQSMHVVANNYDAENGRFTGADMEIITKSGSNQVHGSAFFKASRPGLDAYQRWNGIGSDKAAPATNANGTPATSSQRAAARGVNRDADRFNNWGGSLGGPFWKNHLFGFFNFETAPLAASTTAQGWYETSQFDSTAGTGPIAKKYLTFKGETVAPGSTLVAQNCASIGLTEGVNCNTEAGGLDVGSPLKAAVGNQDLSYGGSSNTPGVGGGLDGVPDIGFFTTINPTTTSQTQYNGRLDAQVKSNDHLTFTIYWVPLTSTSFKGPNRAANLWHHSQVNDAFTLMWNHIFSPTLLNQARINAAGWRWNEIASNPQEPFGLSQDNIDNIGSAPFQNFGAPQPTDFDQWTYSYNDVLTKVWGRHNIKTGGSLTRLYYLNNAVFAARPYFGFHNLWDFANDAPFSEGGEFNAKTGVPFSNREDNRLNIWGFFAQDDWKVFPTLTLNLGLRWSYFSGYYSKENNLDVMQFGPGPDPLTGLNIRVGGNLYTPQKNNWSPEFGFSWQPPGANGKAVLRGGFGINYNQNEIAILANGFGNPPNAVQPNFTCAYPFASNPSCSGTGILYQTATNLSSLFGYPPNPAAITPFSSANLPLKTPISITGFPSHPKTIANYHFSLEGDLQLPYNSVATLGYQGSLMRHLLIQMNWNAIAAADRLALNPVVNFLDYYENSGNGNFNAMVATLAHNFSHGFQAEAEYTWGKAMDENSGPYSEDPYPFNTHLAYARSDYNVQDDFKLFGLVQPVFFHGHNFAEKLAGGWSLGGVWNWHSGFPWNPIYNIAGNAYYASSGYGALRPAAYLGGAGKNTANRTFMGFGGNNPNYGGNGTKFFKPPTYTEGAKFPAISPAPQLGIARNMLNGPDYNDVDASLTKAFGLPNTRVLGENANLSLRVDTYNLFNRTNINTASIDNVIGSVNPDGSLASTNSDFGVARNALGSRTVQLQARFSF
ncbi:MAG TPA: carboxypeptidase regulatory-like domain-containing protein [Terracidiphilus sp.]|nr:carboxypeptidase regulatory-like domain-containing protein [Terracidiphilus sp.]